MDLFIFNDIEEDDTIRAILEKDNTPLLRGIVTFAETEGVTEDSIREFVASRLANDENVLSELAKSGKHIGNDLYRLAMLDIDMIYKKVFGASIKYTPSGNDTGFCEGYCDSIRKITGSASP